MRRQRDEFALATGFFKARQNLQHMILLLAVRAEIAAGAQRLAHVAEAERTGVHVVVEQQRDLLVAGVSRQIACAQTGIYVPADFDTKGKALFGAKAAEKGLK